MAKPSKIHAAPAIAVRTRRAYFDCRFGQLHVRTAFPTTGGFDEGVTLFCLHPLEASSRTFAKFLPQIAADRSVYAPDLPGCGESDAASGRTYADSTESAAAMADLAADLRLRQIDVLGFRFGAAVALELAAARPDLVRRLVLISAPPIERSPVIRQASLVLRARSGVPDEAQRDRSTLPNANFVDLAEHSEDLFGADPHALVKQVGAFLRA